MAQQTRTRLIVVNVLGLLFYIAEGMYFHNVLESAVIGITTLLFLNLWAINSSHKTAKHERDTQPDRDEGPSRL
jgi:hypothetical protein